MMTNIRSGPGTRGKEIGPEHQEGIDDTSAKTTWGARCRLSKGRGTGKRKGQWLYGKKETRAGGGGER